MRATSYLALLLSASTPIFASAPVYDVTIFSQPGCKAANNLGGAISPILGECTNVPIVDKTAQSFSYSYSGEPMFVEVYLGNDCKGEYITYLLDGPWTCHPLRDLKDVSIKVVHPHYETVSPSLRTVTKVSSTSTPHPTAARNTAAV